MKTKLFAVKSIVHDTVLFVSEIEQAASNYASEVNALFGIAWFQVVEIA